MGDGVEGRGTDGAPIDACVQAGGVETPYRRAGRGATVLLLLAGGSEAWGREVFESLRRRARVVRPELVQAVWRPAAPPGGAGAGVGPERWLRDLLEGLGLDRPWIVVDHDTYAALEGFRARNGDEVGGWMVLRPGALPDPEGLGLPETDAD